MKRKQALRICVVVWSQGCNDGDFWGLDRTYEELKLASVIRKEDANLSLDRTYEELKRRW